MLASRTIVWIAVIWIGVLGLYAAGPLLFHNEQSRVAFADIMQCLVPLIANAGLLMNAGTPHWRRNVFWMLLAMGCTLWMIGQFQWTYAEMRTHKAPGDLYAGDMTFFLRGVPMMAALALRPHLKRGELRMRFGYLDFVLLLTWWIFLYAYAVLPWIYASPNLPQYNFAYDVLADIQNMIVVVGLGVLWLRAGRAWRFVYANLFGGAVMYMLSALVINVGISLHQYKTGSLYDLPLVGSFLWFGTAGLIASKNEKALDAPNDNNDSDDEKGRSETTWATRVAMAAVISLPVFAIYTMKFSQDPHEVRDFRVLATVVAAVPIGFLVFLRQHLADKERLRLLEQSEQSIENLQRLQAQLVQSEKLISLGQLAAGAAHEINNPLTAILGYSDLLADDESVPEKNRGIAAKIRDQARRTKTLVGNLLSFARQVPAERTLLDLNTVVSNAVQLRALDLRAGTTKVELQLESVLPGVRGDGNQLMQVFFNIINNAIDAMETANGGGTLTIKTLRDRAFVVVLFSDNGPGIKEPHRVFDPFYTTKPVGKGTGLGLSICFGIVQEHGGRILCYNRQEGGAVFRVELPAVLAALPAREAQLSGATSAPKSS
ncbi:MAG: HAMP domain-containing histidine kinase [Acidobacteria bacterium]|nr:HAMP domain-containing histidine kinase [Acidobacteriota bacterium]MBS1867702.1 HAMP domain-containing histidine kinase [Acidobacteriota bacterium]